MLGFFFLHSTFLHWPEFYFGGEELYVKVILSCYEPDLPLT